jgi:hypothetical protein
VVHFVDPIWLGAQTLMAMELGWAGEYVDQSKRSLIVGTGLARMVLLSVPVCRVRSWPAIIRELFHWSSAKARNLATYARLFGWSWLEPIMWNLQQWLYSK